jgi:hypothetical protein
MFSVKVEKECGCFRRSEYEAQKSFEKRDDAILYSNALAELMNEEFCKKHRFIPKEVDRGEFVIAVGTMPQKSGCCGGGHCS